MKSRPFALALCLLALASCDKDEIAPATRAVNISNEKLKAADMPILPIKAGDYWKYRVKVEVSPGVTSPDAAAMNMDLEKIRTYRGKVQVAEGLPEVDAFDVEVPGQPLERELVEIYEDRIMMRGTIRPNESEAKPLWLDPAVPFVSAGLRPGQEMTRLGVHDGALKRMIQAVAREKVSVPRGEFDSIRLLMTGKDGQFEMRRTIWFVPKLGIVKEEKIRYTGGKLLFRESTELVETNVAAVPK